MFGGSVGTKTQATVQRNGFEAEGVKTGTTDASMLHALNSGVLEAALANSSAESETFTRASVTNIIVPKLVGTPCDT